MTRLPIDTPYDSCDDAPADGNVMAGPLSEVFSVDLIAAVATAPAAAGRHPSPG
ncbi:DUF6510 family protein [Streptomyces sp. ok210]|jgi:hypothetical protein|uniref:DUF6510 family protein n=1 Tax=Streptomyces sp. ok210 TaxID=1761905 RepID=UPI0008E386DF|nr:DUF6510 family protein [Streptomyces sp. ok210]SFT22621.1 hypothetical protein SAMN04487982_110234 [Streptomyces sp. ok210]